MTAAVAKLQALIARKKRADPAGFQAAEASGGLYKYLEADMRRENIDLSVLSEYQSLNGVGDVDIFIQNAAHHLDDIFFDPLYNAQLPSNHMGIAEVMTNYRSAKNVILPLQRVKVVSALGSLICFSMFVRCVLRGYIPYAVIYVVAAADLLRISYNSFDKKYCSLYLNMIGGTVGNVADTIFKFAKTVIGIAEQSEDPFLRLRKEVIWALLIEDTMVQTIYRKVST
jgi:hypothetical protein